MRNGVSSRACYIQVFAKPYPSKNPAECSSRTDNMVIPSSLDIIAFHRRFGSRLNAYDVLVAEIIDLRRTTFSENTLNAQDTKINKRENKPKHSSVMHRVFI